MRDAHSPTAPAARRAPNVGLRPEAAIPAGDVSTTALAWRFGGVLRVTVIAKASFAFALDAAMPRTAPQPIFVGDVHHGNSPERSVRYASDWVPYLHSAQIVFVGDAFAPPGSAVRSMEARISLFDGDDLLFDKSLLVRQPRPFRSVPIVYERAFGGHDVAENPCGTGAAPGSPPPAILHPEDASLDSLSLPRVAGFGPIGQLWPARRDRLESLRRELFDAPIIDLPDDFDWAYFQAAPPDQTIGHLAGDEWILIEGLHPEWQRSYMQLPGARGLAKIHGLAGYGMEEEQPLMLHADTLCIDGEAMICTLTFRGAFEVPSEEALLSVRVVAGVELPGKPIVWPELPRATEPLLAQAAPSRPSRPPKDTTIRLGDGDFESVHGSALAGVLELSTAPILREDPMSHTTSGAVRPAAPPLPFRSSGGGGLSSGGGGLSKPLPKPPPSPRREDSTSLTLDQGPNELFAAKVRKVLPFGGDRTESGPAEAPLSRAAAPETPAPAPKPEPAPLNTAPAPAPKPEPAPLKAAPAPLASSPFRVDAESSATAAPPERPTPRSAAPKPATPGPSPALKKGLYGGFGGKG